jgi:excisionase family DNA binding protein
MPAWLTIQEAAETMGVCTETVYRMVGRGTLRRCVLAGGRVHGFVFRARAFRRSAPARRYEATWLAAKLRSTSSSMRFTIPLAADDPDPEPDPAPEHG